MTDISQETDFNKNLTVVQDWHVPTTLNYKEILKETNICYVDCDPEKRPKGSGGYKYTVIIKPILDELRPSSSLADELAQAATGKGLGNNRLWKTPHNYPVEYMYYHTPEQLTQRLKLLFGERSAGNNNPVITNEIANIRKELSVQKKLGGGLWNWAIDNLPVPVHLPGYKYAGPGTHVELNLEKGVKPINELDKLAMHHDIAYSNSSDIGKRHDADKILLEGAWKIATDPNYGLEERGAAWLVVNMMKAKLKLAS